MKIHRRKIHMILAIENLSLDYPNLAHFENLAIDHLRCFVIIGLVHLPSECACILHHFSLTKIYHQIPRFTTKYQDLCTRTCLPMTKLCEFHQFTQYNDSLRVCSSLAKNISNCSSPKLENS